MKKIILNLLALAVFCGGFVACSDWTEPEAENFFEPKSEAYYQALRDYKKTKHPVTFGWFGNWTGTGTSLRGSLMGLPDSVDFVSMWGNWHSLSPEKIADKEAAKSKKGLRVLMCFIVANVGDQTTPAWVRDDENWGKLTMPSGRPVQSEADAVNAFWGYEEGEKYAAQRDSAIRKYAHSIIDTIEKYDWDGFDYDFEVNYGASGTIAGAGGGDFGDPSTNRRLRENFKIFVEELGKYLGPKSGTDRMLVIDGEPQNMHPDVRDYFDYYIIQAYYSTGYGDLDDRYRKLLRGLEANTPEEIEAVTSKLIYCEDFEKGGYADNGGNYPFRSRDGKSVPSLMGMAMWQPTNGYTKGGIGTYHMEYDYKNNPEYKWLRIATGIMNPNIE